MNRLIVMDGVSGLADKSNNFVSFLITARKIAYIIRFYINHFTAYTFFALFTPQKIWKFILS